MQTWGSRTDERGARVTYRLKKWSGLISLKSCLSLPLCSSQVDSESFKGTSLSVTVFLTTTITRRCHQPAPPLLLSIPFSFCSQTCSLSSTRTKTLPHFCLGFMDSLLVHVFISLNKQTNKNERIDLAHVKKCLMVKRRELSLKKGVSPPPPHPHTRESCCQSV